MYFKFSHECHFHKASTLSQVDAELTRDRFVAMLNDAGFFVNCYSVQKKQEPNHGFAYRNRDNEVNKQTFVYHFCIYWDFNHQIKAMVEEDNFLKQNPSYELESSESKANIFINLRNKFIHEQAKLKLNFEQSLTDELLAKISKLGNNKTGDVVVDSKLFEPMNYFRRGYHVNSLSRHDITVGKEPLISNQIKSSVSKIEGAPSVGFSGDGFNIAEKFVPFVDRLPEETVGRIQIFISGMKGLYLNTETKEVCIVDLSKRCEKFAKENPNIAEIFQPLELTFVPLEGLNDFHNRQVKFYAHQQKESFIITFQDYNGRKETRLFYHDISSEPLILDEIDMPTPQSTTSTVRSKHNQKLSYNYVFHPSKNQFLSTITTIDPRSYSVYGHAKTETKLFKFTKQKISLVDTIFVEQPGETMSPVFSDNDSTILSMRRGSVLCYKNGTRGSMGAYGNTNIFHFSSDKKYLFIVNRTQNQSISYLLNKSGILIKTIMDEKIGQPRFSKGEPEIEEAIQRVMTMVEEAGISIQMEGSASFRMTWNWEV